MEPPVEVCGQTLPSRHRFTVSSVRLEWPGSDPVHDGLRLAQLSDLHLGPGTSAARIRLAVGGVNRFAPDLVLLTGDYVTWSRRPVACIREPLGGFQAPSFAVLGTHDHQVGAGSIRRELEALGYT